MDRSAHKDGGHTDGRELIFPTPQPLAHCGGGRCTVRPRGGDRPLGVAVRTAIRTRAVVRLGGLAVGRRTGGPPRIASRGRPVGSAGGVVDSTTAALAGSRLGRTLPFTPGPAKRPYQRRRVQRQLGRPLPFTPKPGRARAFPLVLRRGRTRRGTGPRHTGCFPIGSRCARPVSYIVQRRRFHDRWYSSPASCISASSVRVGAEGGAAVGPAGKGVRAVCGGGRPDAAAVGPSPLQAGASRRGCPRGNALR